MNNENEIPDLPESAADGIENKESTTELMEFPIGIPFFHNVMFEKEWITREEALMLINTISGSVLIDELKHGKSQKESKKYL